MILNRTLFFVTLILALASSCGENSQTTKKPKEIKSEDSNEETENASILLKRLTHSSIAKLLAKDKSDINLMDWNEEIPKETQDWLQLLSTETNKVSGLLVPFSMAPQFTSLENPRIVLTAPEGSSQRGRIFLAISGAHQQDIEFISWNALRRAFDFGTIESQDGKKKISFAHEPTCFACHRTRSPIFPEATWDNTTANRSILSAFIQTQSALDSNKFKKINEKLSNVLEIDQKARQQESINIGNLIDVQMQADSAFSDITYAGFPFVDPDLSQSFDFDQAIFDAHAMVVVTDWLNTLPSQQHAAQIADNKNIQLTERYPDHYSTLATFKSPFLRNINIVSNEVNEYHSTMNVIPTHKNIQSVLNYNSLANKQQKHNLTSQHRPSNPYAFHDYTVEWQDYFTENILNRIFQKHEPKYQRSNVGEADDSKEKEIVRHDRLCSSCHDGGSGSPRPDYSGFNPLIESEWEFFLASSSKEKSKFFCTTMSAIQSKSAPMPPHDSDEQHSFATYKDSVVLSFNTLKKRFSITCK